MKMTKRIVCLVLAAFLCISCIGCGNDSAKTDGKITKLKMILVGEKPAIYDEIYGKLNEMLRQDIGAEVEVEYYNYSDLQQKYSLLFSTGEDFDIVFAANWVKYNQQAAKNSFMEITDDMLKKNAPKTYETLTDTIKNEAKVNGKMYMVPNTASEYSTYVSLIRGDLREKYGMDKIETVEDYEKYLENVAKNDKNIVPLVNVVAVGSFWGGYKDGTERLEVPKGSEIYYDISTGQFTKKDFEDYFKNQVRKT
ncbi:MAG: ABC transporter substrate-binding protein, partial [Clostridia bacterium]|nr:ABC transporter substrate-binding protein [Clostridia bacterium]